MNIAEVVPLDDYILRVTSEDGKTGLFDVKPYLDSVAFSPLKEKTEFERVHNGRYFIEWDCGADLSADTILARWQRVPMFVQSREFGDVEGVDRPPELNRD